MSDSLERMTVLSYPDLIRAIARRLDEYQQARANFATIVLSSSERTASAREEEAIAATGGITKSVPFEGVLYEAMLDWAASREDVESAFSQIKIEDTEG